MRTIRFYPLGTPWTASRLALFLCGSFLPVVAAYRNHTASCLPGTDITGLGAEPGGSLADGGISVLVARKYGQCGPETLVSDDDEQPFVISPVTMHSLMIQSQGRGGDSPRPLREVLITIRGGASARAFFEVEGGDMQRLQETGSGSESGTPSVLPSCPEGVAALSHTYQLGAGTQLRTTSKVYTDDTGPLTMDVTVVLDDMTYFYYSTYAIEATLPELDCADYSMTTPTPTLSPNPAAAFLPESLYSRPPANGKWADCSFASGFYAQEFVLGTCGGTVGEIKVFGSCGGAGGDNVPSLFEIEFFDESDGAPETESFYTYTNVDPIFGVDTTLTSASGDPIYEYMLNIPSLVLLGKTRYFFAAKSTMESECYWGWQWAAEDESASSWFGSGGRWDLHYADKSFELLGETPEGCTTPIPTPMPTSAPIPPSQPSSRPTSPLSTLPTPAPIPSSQPSYRPTSPLSTWGCVPRSIVESAKSNNTGWPCSSGAMDSWCTQSCGCLGSPGTSPWCCGSSGDICVNDDCAPPCPEVPVGGCADWQPCKAGYFCHYGASDGEDDPSLGVCRACFRNSDCVDMDTKTSASCSERCSMPFYDAPKDNGSCHGYLTGHGSSFVTRAEPVPLDCNKAAEHGYGPREYLSGDSCCSADGLLSTLSSGAGGFVPSWFTFPTQRCESYVDALSSMVCDPRQGSYIYGVQDLNVLRVCRSTCDAVFRECGFFGDDSEQRVTEFTDGTSMCYDLWGGFTYEDPCDLWPYEYPCQTNLRIDVVDEECLSFIEPSDDDIENWRNPDYLAEVCDRGNETNAAVIVGGVVCGVAGVAAFCACAYLMQRHRSKENKLSQEGGSQSTQTPQRGSEDIPIATAIRFPNGEIPEQCAKIPKTTAAPLPFRDAPEPSAPPYSSVVAGAQAPYAVSSGSTSLRTSEAPPAEPSLADLLERGEASNAVDIIQQWTAKNHKTVASLTPDDVARAVSSVSFSLERGEASGELAAGITRAGGAVTCEHILAVIGLCPGQDADIAKAMAPHTTDPENKSCVVDQIQYSFQKEDVEKAFTGGS